MTEISAPSTEHPWLVADIGGTNARFGLVSSPGESPHDVDVLAGAEHEDLTAAVAAYLKGQGGVRPGAACLAMAGPVDRDRYRLTNADWRGSVIDTAKALDIPHIELLNDFGALSMALPWLRPEDVTLLGGPEPAPDLVKAVLGPGTGLGVAGLVPVGGRWISIPGEGGHVDVPAAERLEIEVVRALRAEMPGYLIAEHLISGPGLTRLRYGLGLVQGVRVDPLPAAEIVARTDDPLCAQTVEVFCGLLGTFTGNVALTFGAKGGVYLGGGILPRIVDRLRSSTFRSRFEATPNLTDYLSEIATVLIVSPTSALTGAAAWLEQRMRTA
ncbi:glucokinase [Rhizohabitans arisaemae]|uniref:glucokinase n=1 Tax=Rhizohabitans arisaemae TaxID=2720610 RepID=UPI0024B257DC|nr:glucokinase [Rhizohabitans arisaemae]